MEMIHPEVIIQYIDVLSRAIEAEKAMPSSSSSSELARATGGLIWLRRDLLERTTASLLIPTLRPDIIALPADHDEDRSPR